MGAGPVAQRYQVPSTERLALCRRAGPPRHPKSLRLLEPLGDVAGQQIWLTNDSVEHNHAHDGLDLGADRDDAGAARD
jgi:hypothetical protein